MVFEGYLSLNKGGYEACKKGPINVVIVISCLKKIIIIVFYKGIIKTDVNAY